MLNKSSTFVNNNHNNPNTVYNNTTPTRPPRKMSATEETIRVCVRVRPINENETKRGDTNVIKIQNDQKTIEFYGSVANLSTGINSANAPKTFTYDMGIGDTATQEEVFEKCGVTELLGMALEGYAATIFAYGQTGSGKTYSIVGKEDQSAFHGIVPRAAEYIYKAMNKVPKGQATFSIKATYLEIYNEQVNDLLNLNSVNLPVRYSSRDGFFVENLFIVDCGSQADLMAVIREGIQNRKVSAHELNKDSSRSHSIFTVYIDTDLLDPQTGYKSKRYGKIHFVDLAGSERLKESKSSGSTATETGHINKSLLTLGKVISMLSDSKKTLSANSNTHLQQQQQGPTQHYIPYRDSKLTQLLMDSLGGNSSTIMLACITPSSFHAEETLNTLKYASRAKKIKNKPYIHVDPNETLIQQLKDQIRNLQDELVVYKGNNNNPLQTNLLAMKAPYHAPMPNVPQNGQVGGRHQMDVAYHSADFALHPSAMKNSMAAPVVPKINNPLFPNQAKEKKAIGVVNHSNAVKPSRKLEPIQKTNHAKQASLGAYAEMLGATTAEENEIVVNNSLHKPMKKDTSTVHDQDIQRIKRENIELTKAVHTFKLLLDKKEDKYLKELSVLKEENTDMKQKLQIYENSELQELVEELTTVKDENVRLVKQIEGLQQDLATASAIHGNDVSIDLGIQQRPSSSSSQDQSIPRSIQSEAEAKRGNEDNSVFGTVELDNPIITENSTPSVGSHARLPKIKPRKQSIVPFSPSSLMGVGGEKKSSQPATPSQDNEEDPASVDQPNTDNADSSKDVSAEDAQNEPTEPNTALEQSTENTDTTEENQENQPSQEEAQANEASQEQPEQRIEEQQE